MPQRWWENFCLRSLGSFRLCSKSKFFSTLAIFIVKMPNIHKYVNKIRIIWRESSSEYEHERACMHFLRKLNIYTGNSFQLRWDLEKLIKCVNWITLLMFFWKMCKKTLQKPVFSCASYKKYFMNKWIPLLNFKILDNYSVLIQIFWKVWI